MTTGTMKWVPTCIVKVEAQLSTHTGISLRKLPNFPVTSGQGSFPGVPSGADT